MRKIKEECGVFGIFSADGADVVNSTYLALYALQHRGEESCGIAVNDDGVITGHKDLGLVGDVFVKETLEKMNGGQIAIGHVRYSTTGVKSRTNAQPLIINHVKGSMAIAHNGNLTNASVLREEFEMEGAIFHTTTDSEVIAYTIIKERLRHPSIEKAIEAAMNKLEGAYSLVIMSPTKMVAVRDPNGFRPLCIGKSGNDTFFASESCAFDSIGADFVRDVKPGEIVTVHKDGIDYITTHCGKRKSSLCVFEYIYFARTDSVIDGASVQVARQRAGAFLACAHPAKADVVIGVPDSGLDAALGYSRQSGIPYSIGFIKNRYIGRSFIQPTQVQRVAAVNIKLNPIASVVSGKSVVMIDDSIVRGTTASRIISILRQAGATEVHMRVSSPPFLNPCYFGTDIDSKENLIADKHLVDDLAKIIGADSLGFLTPADVQKIACNATCGFCDACFTGNYPVPIPKEELKPKYQRKLSES